MIRKVTYTVNFAIKSLMYAAVTEEKFLLPHVARES